MVRGWTSRHVLTAPPSLRRHTDRRLDFHIANDLIVVTGETPAKSVGPLIVTPSVTEHSSVMGE